MWSLSNMINKQKKQVCHFLIHTRMSTKKDRFTKAGLSTYRILNHRSSKVSRYSRGIAKYLKVCCRKHFVKDSALRNGINV